MSDPLHPEGNPQGKGMVPVLDALNSLRPFDPGAKAPEQILKEFCLSALVLSSRFDFRVVPGKRYFLYRVEGQWRLSLIAPDEWGQRCPGAYVAACELSPDMTWSMELEPAVADDDELVAALEAHLRGFIERVAEADSLEKALPVYEAALPWQQRMMATALSSSLQTSIIMSGLTGQQGRHWLGNDNLKQLLLSGERR